jgi:hypothetical protein
MASQGKTSGEYKFTPDGQQKLQYIIEILKGHLSRESLQATAQQIILESVRYGSIIDGIRFLNADSISAGYRSLSTSSYPLTFKFSGASGLNHAILASILNHYGFIEATDPSAIGFLMLEFNMGTSKFTREHTLLQCVIKNLLADTKKLITNKEMLYTSMYNENPMVTISTMAATRKLTPELKVQPGEVLIVRPVGPMACCGRGISIVTNDIELNQARSVVQPYQSAIASTYIQNPLLWNGRKFHIRMYLLIRAGSLTLPYHYELWTRGRILTALLPYQNKDWKNKKIHDTHGGTTPHNLWFPEDLPDITRRQEIYDKMRQSIDVVGRIMQKNITMYTESIHAFEVFGCDFLITEDYQAILMEINDHVGFTLQKEPTHYTDNDLSRSFYRDGRYTYDDFGYDYYNWIYALGIHPVYFPQIPPPSLPTFGISI